MKHQRKKKSTFYYYLSILYWSTNCARSLLHSHLVITIYSSFHILSFHTSVIFIVSIVTSDFLHYYVNRYILKQSVFISKLDCTRVSSFSPSPSDSQIYLSQITGFLSHHTWKMIDQRLLSSFTNLGIFSYIAQYMLGVPTLTPPSIPEVDLWLVDVAYNIFQLLQYLRLYKLSVANVNLTKLKFNFWCSCYLVLIMYRDNSCLGLFSWDHMNLG